MLFGAKRKRLEKRTMFCRAVKKMHRLDIPGCLAFLLAALTVFVWCKDQCIDLCHTQQRHLTYVDAIPGIKRDLAGVKQDVAGVKQDVADIKVILSRVWYKRLQPVRLHMSQPPQATLQILDTLQLPTIIT